MHTFTKVLGVGNMTATPRHTVIRGSCDVTNLTVAVNENFLKEGEWSETTSYIDLVMYGSLAAVIKEFPAGTKLFFEGRIKSETWTDKKTKQRKFRQRVVCEKVRIISGLTAARAKASEQEEVENSARGSTEDQNTAKSEVKK